MDEFLKNMTSGYWWLSVVAVGIVVNLVSGILEKRLGGLGSSTSAWMRLRSEKKRKAYQAEVARLVAKPELLPHFFQEETRWRMRALLMLGMFFLVGLMLVAPDLGAQPLFGGSWVRYVGLYCSIGLLISFKLDDRADRIQEIIRDARKVWAEQSSPSNVTEKPPTSP